MRYDTTLVRRFRRGNRTMKRKGGHRALGVECLESRQLLAGDMLVFLDGSTLRLWGDDADNHVAISADKKTDEIVVQGMGTTLNLSSSRLSFPNVESIDAALGDGDDRIAIRGVTLSQRLGIQAGQGDDDVELVGVTINGDKPVLDISGDWNEETTERSGDDSIRLVNTTVMAVGKAAQVAFVRIAGDDGVRSTFAAGNDTIQMVNTQIYVDGGTFSKAFVEVYGEYTKYSDFVGGDDVISLANTHITLVGNKTESTAWLTVTGDFAGDSQFTGGDDSISVVNTTVDIQGGNKRSTAAIRIRGDESFGSKGAGGSDRIQVVNTEITAVGASGERSTYLEVFGGYGTTADGDDTIRVTNASIRTQDTAHFVEQSYVRVGGDGGHDSIDVTNVTIDAPDTRSNGFVALQVFGDGPGSVGDDVVRVAHAQLIGGKALTSVRIITTDGNDSLHVLNSMFDDLEAALGSDGDRVVFNHNTIGGIASLDGGDGDNDRLRAGGNIGVLSTVGFEDEKIR